MLAGLDLQPPESPDTPEETSACAAVTTITAERFLPPTNSAALEQLRAGAVSLCAGLAPVSCLEQSDPQDAMQSLLYRYPLAPARARAQALRAWAALEDGSSCACLEVAACSCTSSTRRPSSAASGSSFSASQPVPAPLTNRPLAAKRSSCSNGSSLTGDLGRRKRAGTVSGPADGSMEGRGAEQGVCTRTQQDSQAKPSCCMDVLKASCDRRAPALHAAACTAGGSSVACAADVPPKRVWSSEEDAWIAHAQWMAGHASGVDGRHAARHMLALLLPHRGSAELGVRWRWCARTPVHGAQLRKWKHPQWSSTPPTTSYHSTCKRC